jgi:hypothetical protein
MDVLQKIIGELCNRPLGEEGLSYMPNMASNQSTPLCVATSPCCSSEDSSEQVTSARTLSRSDPVLPRWNEWMIAHERLLDLCEQQQRLEARLYEIADSGITSPAVCTAADELVKYSEAKQAEQAAFEIEDRLAEALWNTPANSLEGVAGKLFAVVKKGEPSEGSDEFPWPCLRSVLADLLRVERQMKMHD